MCMPTEPLDAEAALHGEQDDPTGRLDVYLVRTQVPLDLLALLTLWIVLVPPSDFDAEHHASTIALSVRFGLSIVYRIDLAIRASLARRHSGPRRR